MPYLVLGTCMFALKNYFANTFADFYMVHIIMLFSYKRNPIIDYCAHGKLRVEVWASGIDLYIFFCVFLYENICPNFSLKNLLGGFFKFRNVSGNYLKYFFFNFKYPYEVLLQSSGFLSTNTDSSILMCKVKIHRQVKLRNFVNFEHKNNYSS